MSKRECVMKSKRLENTHHHVVHTDNRHMLHFCLQKILEILEQSVFATAQTKCSEKIAIFNKDIRVFMCVSILHGVLAFFETSSLLKAK